MNIWNNNCKSYSFHRQNAIKRIKQFYMYKDIDLHTINIIACNERHPKIRHQTIVSRKIFTDESSACLVCMYLVIVLTALLLLLLMPLNISLLPNSGFVSACVSLAVSAARNDNILLSDNCYHALLWKIELTPKSYDTIWQNRFRR